MINYLFRVLKAKVVFNASNTLKVLLFNAFNTQYNFSIKLVSNINWISVRISSNILARRKKYEFFCTISIFVVKNYLNKLNCSFSFAFNSFSKGEINYKWNSNSLWEIVRLVKNSNDYVRNLGKTVGFEREWTRNISVKFTIHKRTSGEQAVCAHLIPPWLDEF